jgi:hypothetical protein
MEQWILLIVGLELEDTSGAKLGLYIRPQARPQWPPAGAVHEATRQHARPLLGGFTALRALGPLAC